MKVLKFRAWCEGKHNDSTWPTPGNYEYDIVLHNGIYVSTETYEMYGDYPTIPIEQYTGLVDVRGKDIYEGDIVESCAILDNSKLCRNVVEYRDCRFIANGTMTKYKSYLVIGNIHENPELLND